MRSRRGLAIGSMLLVGGAVVLSQRPDAFTASRDHPAIVYSTGPVKNAISDLNRRLDDGAARLGFDEANGYLRSALSLLGIPIESQVLVFSQTSAEAQNIGPKNPRAIFFRDAVAVGWVRGAKAIEVAAQDATQGTVFYTLDQAAAAKPRFHRDDTCLACHLTWDTLGVPGPLVLSTFPMPDDKNAYATGFVSDHRSPITDRWGGWYVTGTTSSPHMGNITGPRTSDGRGPRGPTLQNVDGQFDTTSYLSRQSDVVALMVLEHQARMTNLLTRLGWEFRLAAHERPLLKGPPSADADGMTERVHQVVVDLVDYMLFVDEEVLTGPVKGSSGFTDKFQAQGPTDRKGRSFRQLDLTRRLLRYPCSYMIYTQTFDALPGALRNAVYARMWRILSGQETGKPYDRLSRSDRQAILEILRDTKQDLPPSFRTAGQ
jgi:hypothetical protein